MKLPHRLIGIAVTTLTIAFAAGCDRKTSMESTGDRADRTADGPQSGPAKRWTGRPLT